MSIVGGNDDHSGFQNEALRIVKREIRRASEECACVQPHDHWSGYGRQGIPHPDVQLKTVLVACEVQDRETESKDSWTACWRSGTSRTALAAAVSISVGQPEVLRMESPQRHTCLRCRHLAQGRSMSTRGTRRFACVRCGVPWRPPCTLQRKPRSVRPAACRLLIQSIARKIGATATRVFGESSGFPGFFIVRAICYGSFRVRGSAGTRSCR